MPTFGDLIRARRQELGIPQAKVAQLIGRAATTVRTWEQGRSTPTETRVVEILAAVLHLDAKELMAAAGLEPPPSSAPDEHPSVEEIYRSLTATVEAPLESDEWPPPSYRPQEELVIGATAASHESPFIDLGPGSRTDETPVIDKAESKISDPVDTEDANRQRHPFDRVDDSDDFAPSDYDGPAASVVAPGVLDTASPVAPVRPQVVIGTTRPTRATDDVSPVRTTIQDPYPIPQAVKVTSYMESVFERNVYRVRAALTFALLAALFAGLAWAADNLWEGISQLWTEFTRSFR